MKSGLVDDNPMDEGGAVALVAEAQSVEPSGPSRSEVSFETDFVPSSTRSICQLIFRSQLERTSRCGEEASPRVVI